MFAFFLVLVPFVSCVVVEEFTLPPHAVSQDKDGNKVVWPMYDFDLEENLLNHGSHCVEQVQECLNIFAGNGTEGVVEVQKSYESVRSLRVLSKESPMVHRMHCAHCQNLVRLVKRFYEAHPDFVVSDDLCSVVSQVRKRRLVGAAGGAAGRPGYYRRRRSATRKSLLEQENYLKNENFGDLLMKDWKGEQLTKFEANFMRRIESENAVMATARALTCNSGPLAYIELVHLVKDSHEICW